MGGQRQIGQPVLPFATPDVGSPLPQPIRRLLKRAELGMGSTSPGRPTNGPSSQRIQWGLPWGMEGWPAGSAPVGPGGGACAEAESEGQHEADVGGGLRGRGCGGLSRASGDGVRAGQPAEAGLGGDRRVGRRRAKHPGPPASGGAAWLCRVARRTRGRGSTDERVVDALFLRLRRDSLPLLLLL